MYTHVRIYECTHMHVYMDANVHMIHYDSVLIMYNLGVVPEEVGDMSLLSIHFDDHQAGVGMGYHASKQSPRWTPPLHMRLLHHRAKLTLKGQSS